MNNNTTMPGEGQGYSQDYYIEILGERLNVKGPKTKNGKGGYDARRCPVCGGSDCLSIDPGANGQPVLTCRSNHCGGVDIIKAIRAEGLPFPGPVGAFHASVSGRKGGGPADDFGPVLAREAREKQEAEAAKRRDEAARRAGEKYDAAKPLDAATITPYLERKGFTGEALERLAQASGVRQDGDRLLVPLVNEADGLVNIQTIHPDGGKILLKGGAKKGCFDFIGIDLEGLPTLRAPLCVAEGWATAAALFLSTGHPAVMCVDAGNMPEVAGILRSLAPEADIILCADDDDTPEKPNRKAIEKAQAAARAVGGKVALPRPELPATGRKVDFWDVWHEAGPEAVARAVETAIAPEAEADLPPWAEGEDGGGEYLERIAFGPGGMEGKPAQPRKSTADKLVDLALKRCDFLHDAAGKPFAQFSVVNRDAEALRFDCLPIRSTAFREWLGAEYYRQTSEAAGRGKAACDKDLKTAQTVLSATAKNDGAVETIFRRVAFHEDAWWIDLADADGRMVRVTADGWTVETARMRPIFTRLPGMASLPVPQPGGDIAPLWRFANIPTDKRGLVLAWTIQCLMPAAAYPVLELTGEQGSAKSSTQEYLRAFIDPNAAPLSALPDKPETLFLLAHNAHVVSLENISSLKPELQDALCCLSTGGAYSGRTLYTNDEICHLQALAPVILNGIGAPVTRQDLVERTLHIELPTITRRRMKADMARDFEAERPGIFGGLLDLFAATLARLPDIEIEPEDLPRMADFAHIGEAVYRAGGRKPGEFLADYRAAELADVHLTIDANPVALALLSWLEVHPEGYAGPIGRLHAQAGEYARGRYPENPKQFADAFKRIAPALRKIGIDAHKDGERRRDGYHCVLKRRLDPQRWGDGTGVSCGIDVQAMLRTAEARSASATLFPA